MSKNIHYNKYYTVAVTGHRDLLEDEIEQYKREIKNYLTGLKSVVNKPILLVSPIADGADRLFIEVGSELGFQYEVIIPMPVHLYTKDFSESSLVEFNSLLIHAKQYGSIDIVDGKTENDISEYGEARDQQYFAVGKFLAENCDELVALWDGEYNQKVGGTADVVTYRKELGKDFYHVECKREGRM